MSHRSITKSKRSRVVNWTLVGLVLLCSLVLASDSVPPVEEDEWDIPTLEEHGLDFALWNECQKFRLATIVHNDEDAVMKLKKEKVQTLFESRLRAAKLTGSKLEDDTDILIVDVSIGLNKTFVWELSYDRWLDIGYGEYMWAEIWRRGGLGIHSSADDGFVMQKLSEAADAFILKYLTVNEQACEDKD